MIMRSDLLGLVGCLLAYATVHGSGAGVVLFCVVLLVGAGASSALRFRRQYIQTRVLETHTMSPSDATAPAPITGPPRLAQAGAGYSVVQASAERIDYGQLAQVLSRAANMAAVDAAFALRRCPGNLLVSGLTQEAANDFVGLLSQQGTPALSLPDSQLITVDSSHRVKSVDFGAEAVELRIDGAAEPIAAPLPNVLMALVGMVSTEHEERTLDTVRQGPEGAQVTVVKTHTNHKHTLEADLYIRTPQGTVERFCVDAHHANFAYLGERRKLTGAENVRVWLADLLERRPDVFAPAELKRFMDGSVAPRFPTRKDFEGTASGYLQVMRATELLNQGQG